MKYFKTLTWDMILWEISWPNLMLLSASIPSYQPKEDGGDENSSTPIEQIPITDVTNFFNF